MNRAPSPAKSDLLVSDTAPTGDADPLSLGLGFDGRARRGLVLLFPRDMSLAPRVWRVEDELTVGRSREANLQFTDDRVSRMHAVIEPSPDGLVIRDRESRHGTFVDGKRIDGTGALANHGSIVRIGDTLLLAADDVDCQAVLPRRISGESLGLTHDMLAGPELAQVWDEAARVAELQIPVLVVGESGSGKECVARIFHRSATLDGPFVAINVAAIPENLFEAEFFGYERGAFTGAGAARKGVFREASGGVLFLDEIGTRVAARSGSLTIDVKHLPDLRGLADRDELKPDASKGGPLTDARIRSAMQDSGGVAAHAAEALGISRTTLYKSVETYLLQKYADVIDRN